MVVFSTNARGNTELSIGKKKVNFNPYLIPCTKIKTGHHRLKYPQLPEENRRKSL